MTETKPRLGIRTNPQQYEIMIEFMERHGDLSHLSQTPKGRQQQFKQWRQLTKMLNNRALGEAKTTPKWRKAWSDLKNQTRKKVDAIRINGKRRELSDLEKRVLTLVGARMRRRLNGDVTSGSMGLPIKEEVIEQEDSSSPHRDPESRQRQTSETSSTSSTSTTKSPTRIEADSDLEKDILDKYLEHERERERMAHEREVARIRQHDQLLSMLGRMVNVVESLAPNILRYLNRENKDS